MNTPMTESELNAEWNYRYQERLAILCAGKYEPTPGMIEIATREANEWRKNFFPASTTMGGGI